MLSPRSVEWIGVPFDLGAGTRGARLGPDSVLQAGLELQLKNIKVPFINQGNIVPPELPSGDADSGDYTSNLRHLGQVAEVNRLLADRVEQAAANGHFPLVLGGDHSIAIGTLSGLARHYSNLGVLWIDAHSDLNTAATTPSGNIHGMSLAAGLGFGHPSLTGIKVDGPSIKAEHIALIAARSLDTDEKAFIRSQGIACFTMHDIDRKGMARVMEDAIARVSAGTDGVHLSFDVDSMDPAVAPGTGTPVIGGLNFREAHLALELLHESGIVTSAEFVEVNPLMDDNNKTSRLVVSLICSLLGETIL